MITNEQILEYAEKYLDVFPDDVTATKKQLIEFAQKIYEIGNENGWESRADAERAKDKDTLIVSQPTNPTRIPIEQSINRVKR